MATAAAVAIPVAALVFLLFCIANYYSLGRDVGAARHNVSAAFADGTLQGIDWLPGNTDIGHHQFNDCLILHQAIDQAASREKLMVSPLKPLAAPGQSLCFSLRDFAAGKAEAGPQTYYHQYIHGHTMLVRYLLPVMPIDMIRMIYRGFSVLLVIAGLAVSLIALARRRSFQSLFWLIVFAAFARWFGLESFGQSLSHGPADAIILVYLLGLAIGSARGGISLRTAIVATALFGALSAVFDFLTGGIPLGLAVVIGGLPFACLVDEPDDLVRLIVGAVTAFCAAFITCLALKLLLAVWVFGIDSLLETAFRLSIRLGLNESYGETTDLGPLHMAKSLTKGLNSLAAGMPLLAGLMLATAMAAGLWGFRILSRSPDRMTRIRAWHVLASNLVMVLILAGFWQHTIVHAWFMDRVFVWTIGSGFGLFALALWTTDKRAA